MFLTEAALIFFLVLATSIFGVAWAVSIEADPPRG